MAKVSLTTTIPSTSGATQYELQDIGINYFSGTVRATVILYNSDGKPVETFHTIGSASDFGIAQGILDSIKVKAVNRLKALNRIN